MVSVRSSGPAPLRLSPREVAVATRAATGSSIEEISVALGISVATVDAYLESARAKYRDRGRSAGTELALRAALTWDGLLD